LNTLAPGQRWMLAPPGVWLMVVLAVVVFAFLRYTAARPAYLRGRVERADGPVMRRAGWSGRS